MFSFYFLCYLYAWIVYYLKEICILVIYDFNPIYSKQITLFNLLIII